MQHYTLKKKLLVSFKQEMRFLKGGHINLCRFHGFSPKGLLLYTRQAFQSNYSYSAVFMLELGSILLGRVHNSG